MSDSTGSNALPPSEEEDTPRLGHLIEPTEEGIAQAADLLRRGELLAFPTETVYGLGANALNAEAVFSIFRAKGRPLTDPLIVHIAFPADAHELVSISAEEERVFNALSETFWPGPLTIIVNASQRIPAPVTANTGFVGIRCPKHALAHRLLCVAKVPVAAPSANRFGHVSPTRASHVLADLAEKGVRVLNGESPLVAEQTTSCEFGIESTVIKLDEALQQVQIFRQGAISQRQLEKLLLDKSIEWQVVVVSRTVKMHGTKEHAQTQHEGENVPGQVAPGQAVTHYAPDVPCFIVDDLFLADSPALINTREKKDDHVALSLTTEDLAQHTVVMDFGGQLRALEDKVLAYRDLSQSGSSAEAARLLFDTLRWSETIENAERVLVAKVDSVVSGAIEALAAHNKEVNLAAGEDLTLGVADRIFRAASGVHATVRLV